MPTPEENLRIGQEVIKEVKTLSVSSNDIILRAKLPVLLKDQFEAYRRQFGEAKVARFLAFNSKLAQLRDKAYELAVSKSAVSPIMVARLATARHGVGECLESSVLATVKLLEKRQPCFMAFYQGKPNIFRSYKPFDHAIVLFGDVDMHSLAKISDFVKQPANVMVVDAFLGYVGPARNYLRDNYAYLDEFKFEHALLGSQIAAFGEAECARVSTLLSSAKKVGEALSKKEITVYERHPDDMPLVLRSQEKPEVIHTISTYPAKLFDINYSQEQMESYRAAMTFKVEDECGAIVANALPSADHLSKTVTQFFQEPLPEHHFKDGEIPVYTPKPL